MKKLVDSSGAPDRGLDPEDWASFSAQAHGLLDKAIAKLRTARQGPVWQAVPDTLKASLDAPVPISAEGETAVGAALADLLPYGVGNTHPRFFGWVHGSGAPGNLLADIVLSAMNVNAGGRDHAAIYVERQVVAWCRDLFGFPEQASGLVVSGTSMATLIALKVARDRALGAHARDAGLSGAPLVGYASAETHSCVARAFDMLGLGRQALRAVPVNDAFEIDCDALAKQISADREAGFKPFVIIGNAGTVNTGAIDDLSALADLAKANDLWFHVDGAFGASGILSELVKPRLAGIERADSLAFDFHKWLHVNYDAGCVLVRDGAAHRAAFSDRPDYLERQETGLAGGAPWPVEFGPELSRSARAIRVWAHLKEHGIDRLGRLITRNCQQAQYLAERVDAHPRLERMAPVKLGICCFRVVLPGLDDAALDELNRRLVVNLQESGLAAPSTTRIGGRLAIRVNLTNHRTQVADLDQLVANLARGAEAIAPSLMRD